MGVFEQLPYSNYHDANLDWMLQTVKQDAATVATISEQWTGIQADVQKMLTTQTSILDEAKGYADSGVVSANAALASKEAAQSSATAAAGSATGAANSAASAASSVTSIGNTAQTVINKATSMDVVYTFFQNISSSISSDTNIQTAAQQIALALANTLIMDGGEPTSVATNIYDGGTI